MVHHGFVWFIIVFCGSSLFSGGSALWFIMVLSGSSLFFVVHHCFSWFISVLGIVNLGLPCLNVVHLGFKIRKNINRVFIVFIVICKLERILNQFLNTSQIPSTSLQASSYLY